MSSLLIFTLIGIGIACAATLAFAWQTHQEMVKLIQMNDLFASVAPIMLLRAINSLEFKRRLILAYCQTAGRRDVNYAALAELVYREYRTDVRKRRRNPIPSSEEYWQPWRSHQR